MKFTGKEKKQIVVFAAAAFGVPYLMGILMWAGYRGGADLTAFPNAQMMYPAAGSILALLLTDEDKRKLPLRFFVWVLAVTGFLMVCAAGSVLAPGTFWNRGVSLGIMVGSVAGWIVLLTEKKEKRRMFGLCGSKWGKSVFCILLFVFLYVLRTAVSYAMTGMLPVFGLLMSESGTWMMAGITVLNFFVVYLAFFGEEYGWRYFLQPRLQERFGKRKGVLLLGVLWGLWHLPLNFFYYSAPSGGLVSAAAQQITCITLGIFFAWCYMKTQNLWVVVILHFLNNNLIMVMTGVYSSSVIEGQQLAWADLLPSLVINGVLFGSFFLSGVFGGKRRNGENFAKERD